MWGPNGGYVAAIALRAALAESRLPRPASFHCQFLAVGEFAPVEVHVASLGGGKRAEALRIEVAQGQRLLILDAQHRDLVHGADIGVERSNGTGDRQVVGDKRGGHRGFLHVGDFSSRHL